MLALLLIGCDSAPPATPTPRPLACTDLATVSQEKPGDGWKLTGHVELYTAKAQLSEARAVDASGKVLRTHPITGAEQAHAVLLSSICEAGGVGATGQESNEPQSGVPNEKFVFDVYAPNAENESVDLARICTEPEEKPGGGGFGAVQFAHKHLAWLTSSKWRTWHRLTERAILEAKNEGDARAIARKRGRELAKEAEKEGRATCWYATVLDDLAGAPSKRERM